MTDNLYRQEFEARFLRLAERDAPAPVDFSASVMSRLAEGGNTVKAGRPDRRRFRSKRPAYAVLLAALSIVLLSGIAYAATKTDWFVIRDDSGRELMKVKGYEQLSEAAIIADRVQETVTTKLSPGETALLLIGQDDIDQYMRAGMVTNGTLYHASRSLTYNSLEELLSRLTGELKRVSVMLPGDTVGDAKLAYVELIPDLSTQDPIPSDQWKRDADPESGTPYAYHVFPVDQDPFPADRVSLRFTYEDGGITYRLGVVYAHGLGDITLYDTDPSIDRVRKVEGVPVYERNEKNQRFTWTVPSKEGGLLMLLDSPQADSKQQLSFAEAVIQATSAEETN